MDFTDANIAEKLNKPLKAADQAGDIVGGLKKANSGIDQVESIVGGINNIINKLAAMRPPQQQQAPAPQQQAPVKRIPQLIINDAQLEARIKDYFGMMPEDVMGGKNKLEENFEKNKGVVMQLFRDTIKDVVVIG